MWKIYSPTPCSSWDILQNLFSAVPPGSLKLFIWIQEVLHETLLGSHVTLFRSKCNDSCIQMKHFEIQGALEKTNFVRCHRNFKELKNNSFTVNLTLFWPKSYKKIVQRATVSLKPSKIYVRKLKPLLWGPCSKDKLNITLFSYI